MSSGEWRTREGEYDKERDGDGTLGLNEISSSESSEIAFRPIAPSFARLPEELDFNWAEGTDKEGSVYPDYRTYAFAVRFFFFRIILENFSCIFSRERNGKRERERRRKKEKAVKISETRKRRRGETEMEIVATDAHPRILFPSFFHHFFPRSQLP